MQIWMIMIGTQFLLFTIAGVMVVVWMRRPKDRYDILLEEMAQRDRAQTQAKKEAAAGRTQADT